MSNTINTFIIYAREDKDIKQRILAHLNSFAKAYDLVLWHDEYLEAGQEWKPHIESRLEQTDLFLLLISVDFMNSEFINQVEFKFAIDRHKTNKSVVIPIIINYCQWDIDFNFTDDNFNLNELQVLPQEGKPVDDWKTPEQAYNNIASGVRKVLETIKARKKAEEKIQVDFTKQQAEVKLEIQPDLPEEEEQVTLPIEKADTPPLQNSVFNNENISQKEIVTAPALDDSFINNPDIALEEAEPVFWRRKKYLFIILALVVLICIIYVATCNTDSGKTSNENVHKDTAVMKPPLNETGDSLKKSIPGDESETPVKKKAVIISKKSTPKFDLTDEDKVYSKVEVEAGFAGGDDGWRNYLRKNLIANTPVNNGAPAGTYTVIVKFIVSKDGSLRDVVCENDPGYGMCPEAVTVIKKGPNWIPATQNGRYVNAYRRQPITFLVQ